MQTKKNYRGGATVEINHYVLIKTK